MRTPRNLSGCFFRFKNPETGRYDNVCYEDLPREERERQLVGRTDEWKTSLIHILADTVVKLGDTFDIGVSPDDDDGIGDANAKKGGR